MKVYRLILSFFVLSLILSSCNSTPVTVKATGLPYEIVVNMDESYWNGELGQAVKDELLSAIPGLPSYEPSTRITYASPQNFNGLLLYVKNVLVVRVDPTTYTKVGLNSISDRWAKGQIVVYLNTPDTESAIAYLKENSRIIVNFITEKERERTLEQLQSSYSALVNEKAGAKFGISLKVPPELTSFRDTTGFFWASNNAGSGRMDVVVYDFPYIDPNTFTVEYLIAKRDSVMKRNMLGAFPNSYMLTETYYAPVTYTPLNVNDKYVGELRGLWKMHGDMMGGPFVSHVRLDEANNRIIVVEAFVYAPETDKRNFIRRMESALYTLRLPGDKDFTNG